LGNKSSHKKYKYTNPAFQKAVEYLSVFKTISFKKISDISGLNITEVRGFVENLLDSGILQGEYKSGVFYRDLPTSKKKKELLLKFLNSNSKSSLKDASVAARLSMRQTTSLIDSFLKKGLIKGKLDSSKDNFINFSVEGKPSDELEVKRDFDYVGGNIRFKVVVRNVTKSPITEISVMINTSMQYIIDEPIKTIKALLPGETRGIDFMLTPVTCGISKILGVVTYSDPYDETYSVIIKPQEIQIKCPLVLPTSATNNEIANWQKTLLKSYSTIPFHDLPPLEAFNISCDQISAMDLKQIDKNNQDLISTYAGIAKVTGNRIVIVIRSDRKEKINKIIVWSASLKEATGFIAYLKNLIQIALDVAQLKVRMKKIGQKIVDTFEISKRLFPLCNFCMENRLINEILLLLKEIKLKLTKGFENLTMIDSIDKWETLLNTRFNDDEPLDEITAAQLYYDALNWIKEIYRIADTNINTYAQTHQDDLEAISESREKLKELKNQIMAIENGYASFILKYLMIIYKLNGLVVYSQPFGGIEIDDDLISGFLTAITSFGAEISRKETSMKSIRYQDFEIEIEDGKYVRAAIVLIGKATEFLLETLQKFIMKFENFYEKDLNDWIGDTSPFESTNHMINEVFTNLKEINDLEE